MNVEFIDTDVLIYAHDASSGAKQHAAIDLVARLARNGQGALSAQVLTEFFWIATRKIKMPSEEALSVIEDLGEWAFHSPSHSDIVQAIRLQRRHKLSWWDALVLTSALELGCKTLWTEDFNNGQKFGSLTVRNPFA